MTDMISVENIIYGSYVKMSRLEPIVFETFSNTSIANALNVNIFIDLYSVLKQIFSEHYRTDISDYTAITSGVINMCGHYRSFFKRLSVNTRFFLIFSFNTCDINRKFVSGYNEVFKRKSEVKVFADVAQANFELLDILCPYLPDIFFIKSPRNYESAVIMASIIQRFSNGYPNLIISKDIYPLQLCYSFPYTSYLYPIKRRGGIDESIMIPISEKYNFRHEFWNTFCNLRRTDASPIEDLSPINFPLVLALNRFPERNIEGLDNIRSISKMIRRLVGANDVKIVPQQLYMDQDYSTKVPVASVESRINAIDIDYMIPIYNQDPESQSIRLDNLRDDTAVNQIVSKFFNNNPINLNAL